MKPHKFRSALLLSLASGCAALAHELLWTRRLIDLIGASHESVARVFGCFFLGLAIGSVLATRWTAKPHRLWRTIAIVEFGIALATIPALTFPWWTTWIWPALGPTALVGWPGWLVKWGASIVVVLPPSILMGMTLPLMGAAVLTGDQRLGKQGIWLYSVNTAGGVLGLVATSAIALRLLGVSGTMGLAACLNLLVAAGCRAMDQASLEDSKISDLERVSNKVTNSRPGQRKKTKRQKEAAKQQVPQNERSSANSTRSDSSEVAMPLSKTMLRPLLLAFASGMGVLAAEVLSVQLFAHILPVGLYVTTGVLTCVILLMALAAWITPWLIARWGPADRLLPGVCTAAAIGCAVGPMLFVACTDQMELVITASSELGVLVMVALYVLLTLGPAFFMAGLVLPLVFSLFGGGAEESGQSDPHGRRWGWLLAVNGLGGLIGAELSGRVLVPLFGMHVAMGAVGLLYATMGAGLCLFSRQTTASIQTKASFRVWAFALGSMALVIVVMWFPLRRLPLIGGFEQSEIIEVMSGPSGVVAVVDRDPWKRAIVEPGQYLLGSSGGFHGERRNMLLPLLLHPEPKTVAAIGLATGITAGAALDEPMVEHVSAVELSPLVVAAATTYFAEENRGVGTGPRSSIVVEDGRTFIAASPDRFDVVVGDLFQPWSTGVGRLYSREHFRDVRGSLRHGGLFCQWLPMHQLTIDQFEVISATMLEIFPRIYLVRGSFRSTIPTLGLIGMRDGEPDWGGVENRCRRMRETGKVLDPFLRHPEGVAMYVLGILDRDDVADSTINTLGNAWLELTAARQRATAQGNYLSGNLWIEFEQLLATFTDPISIPGAAGDGWSKLGSDVCMLHALIIVGRRQLSRRNQDILSRLPDSVRDDPDSDWTAWPFRHSGRRSEQ